MSGTVFPRMRCVWLLALILASCSKGPDADLQYIKQARSLGAEWALVNEQAAEGKVTKIYASSMHEWQHAPCVLVVGREVLRLQVIVVDREELLRIELAVAAPAGLP